MRPRAERPQLKRDPLGSIVQKEPRMRLAAPVMAIGLALWGTNVRAQATPLPHPSLPAGQPSFRIQSFGSTPMSRSLLPPRQVPSLSSAARSQFEPVRHVDTCPMPVAHTDTAKE